MKLEVGMLLKTKTKTKDNVFGECLWTIEAVGVEIDNPNNPSSKVKDGVRCVLLGGSGPAARKGFTVYDREAKILADIESGVSEIVPPSKKGEIISYYGTTKDGNSATKRVGGTGVVEL